MNRPLAAIMFLFVGFVAAQVAFAQETLRTWKDKTGRFEVKAKLLGVENDKAKLLKEDQLVVNVPLSALSPEDQKYIQAWQSAANPFAGGTPIGKAPKGSSEKAAANMNKADSAAKKFSTESTQKIAVLPTDGEVLLYDTNEDIGPIKADVNQNVPKFIKFARPLEKVDAYTRTSSPVVVDPAKSLFAVSIHRRSNAVKDTTFGRIYLVGGDERKARLVMDLGQTIKIVDHHPATDTSLILVDVDDGTERGGDVALLKGLANGQPVITRQWHVPNWNKPGFKPKVEKAKLLNDKEAIVVVNNDLYLWNLDEGKLVKKMNFRYSSGKLQFSANGKYLAIPIRSGAVIVNLKSGEVEGKIEVDTALQPEIRFSPDGTKLGFIAGNDFAVWDLSNGVMYNEARLGSVNGTFFGWVGNQYLLTSLGGLIDIDLGITVWKYSVSTGGQAITVPGGVVMVDRLNDAKVLSLPLPSDRARAVVDRISKNDGDLLEVSPGTSVSIEVEFMKNADEKAMNEAIERMVKRSGWKIDSKSDVTIKVILTRGKKQDMYFRPLFNGFYSKGEKVSMQPIRVSAHVIKGGKTIWSKRAENMLPPVINLAKGQKLKKVLTQYANGYPKYFDYFHLPSRIVKTDLMKKVGRSVVKNNDWYTY